MTYIASLGLSAAIGLAAMICLHKVKSWSHPAVMFGIFWCAMTLLPILGVPELNVSPAAIAYILATVVAFSMPAFFIQWKPALTTCGGRAGHHSFFADASLLLVAATVSLQVIVLAMMVVNLRIQGFSLATVLSDPLSIGCRFTELRYSEKLKPNAFSSLGTIANYIGAVAAGFLVGATRRKRIACLGIALAIFPSLLHVILYADKGTIFLASAFFFGAILVVRIASGVTHLINYQTLAGAGFAVAFVFPILAASLLNREAGSCSDGRTQAVMGEMIKFIAPTQTTQPIVPERKSRILYIARSYSFAHMYAFSDWFQRRYVQPGGHYTDPAKSTLGFWTFMAIGRHIDKQYAASLPAGYYDEYFRVENIIQTNIYTWYRGLLYDFGIVGSLLFMVAFGAITSLAYRSMLLRAFSPFAGAFYVFLIGMFYQSYIISVLTWNSPAVVPFAAFGLIVASYLYSRLFGNARDRSSLESRGPTGPATAS